MRRHSVIAAAALLAALGLASACSPQGSAEAPAPAIIGEVTDGATPLVVMESAIGARRILDMPSGEQLPRIC